MDQSQIQQQMLADTSLEKLSLGFTETCELLLQQNIDLLKNMGEGLSLDGVQIKGAKRLHLKAGDPSLHITLELVTPKEPFYGQETYLLFSVEDVLTNITQLIVQHDKEYYRQVYNEAADNPQDDAAKIIDEPANKKTMISAVMRLNSVEPVHEDAMMLQLPHVDVPGMATKDEASELSEETHVREKRIEPLEDDAEATDLHEAVRREKPDAPKAAHKQKKAPQPEPTIEDDAEEEMPSVDELPKPSPVMGNTYQVQPAIMQSLHDEPAHEDQLTMPQEPTMPVMPPQPSPPPFQPPISPAPEFTAPMPPQPPSQNFGPPPTYGPAPGPMPGPMPVPGYRENPGMPSQPFQSAPPAPAPPQPSNDMYQPPPQTISPTVPPPPPPGAGYGQPMPPNYGNPMPPQGMPPQQQRGGFFQLPQ